MMKSLFTCFVGFLVVGQLHAQIQRVAPPFWWADMPDSSLTLMLYGPALGSYQVSLDQPISFEEQRPSNDNYLLLHLDLAQQPAQQFTIQLTHSDRPPLAYKYQLYAREKSLGQQGFDSADVVYLIMPDRFANGDASNDTTPLTREMANRQDKDGRHGGDLRGIINHLDYLQQLGVTTLWLTPVCTDDDEQVSYHTYAQSDLYQIDPRYGSLTDYKELSDTLHAKGMKLLMDYVTNHWATHHWMVVDPPEADIVHRFGAYTETNHRKEIYADPYSAATDRNTMESGWFVPSMADLNQTHPLLQRYLIQNALWWIEYAQLDGFRVDTYPYNDPSAMQTWVGAIQKAYPGFTIVGESWVEDPVDVAFWQKDSPVAQFTQHNTSLPVVMDFPLRNALLKGFQQENQTWQGGVDLLYRTIQKDYLYAQPNDLLVFLENHDTERLNQLFPKFEDYQRLLKVICTLRGIPQLYYGSEIGMQGEKSKGDGDIRRDFPGGWSSDVQNAFKATERTAQQRLYFDFTQKLLHWRQKHPAIHHGKTLHYVPNNDQYVYFRVLDTERIMVVVNNNTQPQKLDWHRYQEGTADRTKAVEALSKHEYIIQEPFWVPAKTTLIFELKNDDE